MRVRAGVIFAVVLACSLACASSAPAATGPSVRVVKVHYRAHNGKRRSAYVVLPAWYGPRKHPRLPLVISPHGRGITGRANARLWGALPARGGFAVVSPDGQGRVLALQSWGAVGQIDDLARMPRVLHLARHPHLLAGVAAFDAVTDFALQYREFPHLGCDKRCLAQLHGAFGDLLQAMARREVGGSPSGARLAWRLRSPITYVRRIATAHVPLELWWSSKDAIVLDQARQTKRLYDEIHRLNPNAPVAAYQGYWRHSAEMRASTRLPLALADLGLLPQLEPTQDYQLTLGVNVFAAPTTPGPPQLREAAAGEAWPADHQD